MNKSNQYNVRERLRRTAEVGVRLQPDPLHPLHQMHCEKVCLNGNDTHNATHIRIKYQLLFKIIAVW